MGGVERGQFYELLIKYRFDAWVLYLLPPSFPLCFFSFQLLLSGCLPHTINNWDPLPVPDLNQLLHTLCVDTVQFIPSLAVGLPLSILIETPADFGYLDGFAGTVKLQCPEHSQMQSYNTDDLGDFLTTHSCESVGTAFLELFVSQSHFSALANPPKSAMIPNTPDLSTFKNVDHVIVLRPTFEVTVGVDCPVPLVANVCSIPIDFTATIALNNSIVALPPGPLSVSNVYLTNSRLNASSSELSVAGNLVLTSTVLETSLNSSISVQGCIELSANSSITVALTEEELRGKATTFEQTLIQFHGGICSTSNATNDFTLSVTLDSACYIVSPSVDTRASSLVAVFTIARMCVNQTSGEEEMRTSVSLCLLPDRSVFAFVGHYSAGSGCVAHPLGIDRGHWSAVDQKSSVQV